MAFGFGKIKQVAQLPGKAKDMLSKAKETENEMRSLIIEARSDDESVYIQINGLQELIDITIEDDLLTPERSKELYKQIKSAFKIAQKKLQKEMMKGMDMEKLKAMLG